VLNFRVLGHAHDALSCDHQIPTIFIRSWCFASHNLSIPPDGITAQIQRDNDPSSLLSRLFLASRTPLLRSNHPRTPSLVMSATAPTMVGRYKCPGCSNSYKQRGDITRHFAKAHPAQVFDPTQITHFTAPITNYPRYRANQGQTTTAATSRPAANTVKKAQKVKAVDRKAVNLDTGAWTNASQGFIWPVEEEEGHEAEAEAPAPAPVSYEYPDPEECELAP